MLLCGFLGVAALLVGYLLLRQIARLRGERNELLNQKDVVFSFVYDVGEVFAGAESIEVPELLKRVLSYALRTTRAGAGALYLVDEDGETLKAAAVAGVFPPIIGGVDAEMESAFSKVRHVEKLVREQTARVGHGLVGEVVARGMPVLIQDAELDSRVPTFKQDFLRVRSILLAPLRFRQRVIGVIVVVNRIDGQSFAESDANLLQALVDQAAVSIHYARVNLTLEEKRRIDYDLNVAKQIQTALLPRRIPGVAGVELAAFSLPAQQVGGDYYDFVEVDGEHLGIAIADVSGKGIPGAIMMSICRSILRVQAPGCLSPAHVLKAVNGVLSSDLSEGMFVSMLYMILNTRTRALTVARAGHPEPVLCPARAGGARQVLSAGMAIGLGDAAAFGAALAEVSVSLAEGDAVAVFTDGVTEAVDRQGHEWGLRNLVHTMETTLVEQGTVQNVADRVRERLLQFSGDQPQHDDMTLVILRVTQEGQWDDKRQKET